MSFPQLPEEVSITEVGPRDGFQNVKEWIPTPVKQEIIDGLAACGFRKIEVTSFVNPKAVPQMADAKEIVKTTKARHPGLSVLALAPNLRGAADAIEAGADQIAYIVSASERHNLENTRQTIDQSLQGLAEVCGMRGATRMQLSIPTVFNCPWGGKVPPENVVKIIDFGLSLGVEDIGIADTIGSAHPVQIVELLELLWKRFPGLDPLLHLHDTRGMAMAGVLAALQMGITRFDAAVGGLGGCPFAPGAAGNIATEDLVNMLDGMGVKSGIDLDKLLAVAYRAQELLPVPIASRMTSALKCARRLE